MIGVLVNTLTVIVGSLIGLFFKKGIPKKISDAIMLGIGLCTIYIGISGMLEGNQTLIVIISMVLGAIVGTALELDDKINAIGNFISRRFQKKSLEQVSITEGFVTASLLFCIGAMTIVGSLNAGLTGDNKMLFTKSVLDFISSIMLSVSLGIGVLISALFVFIFQGGLVLLSTFLQPILSQGVISEITCVGSILILALGLNIIGITKIKVVNYLPSLFFIPFLCWISNMISFF